MDLYIDRDEFSRGLSRVQSIIERRSIHPLLAHVLLSATDSSLRMTATDTEVAFIGDLAANVDKPGDIAVDAANLFQITRALPEPTVHLRLGTGNRLEIRSGRSFFRLPGSNAEDFPQLPAFDGQSTITITESSLRRLVDQTHFAVASDDVRYGLNGVHIELAQTDGGAALRLVSTDGHRLCCAQSPFKGELSLSPRTLVPRKALAVIRKLVDGGDNEVELSFGDGAIRLSRPGQVFWFRMLEGEFPDYAAVVPVEHKMRVTCRKTDLAATLRRVLLLVQERNKVVRFAFDNDQLEIEVHNVERGDINESLPVEIDGDTITVGFNARFLQDVLSVLKGEHVVLEQSNALAPCLIRDPDDSDAFFVIMPMRLD